MKDRRKQRNDKKEIMRQIYLRLANWKTYKEDYDKEKQEVIEGLSDYRLSSKPKKQKDIERWLKNDHESTILTLDKGIVPGSNGWVLIDHIEADPCPYGSPKAHRKKYLNTGNNSLIEENYFFYRVKKDTSASREDYTQKVYRLKRDKKTLVALSRLLTERELLTSDYFQSIVPESTNKLAILNRLLFVLIWEKVSLRNNYGEQKRINEQLSEISDKIQKQIKEIRELDSNT